MKNVDNLKLWCLFRQRLSLQGEQNIVSAIDNALGKLGLVINSDNEIVSDEEQVEQKPYGQRKECKDCQMNYAGECKGSCSMKRGEQNPAEWGEKDEKMCQETIDWFEKKCFPYALESENPARESIKWLKSFKERYTWKPSDEQMEAVRLAAEIGTANNSWAMNIL